MARLWSLESPAGSRNRRPTPRRWVRLSSTHGFDGGDDDPDVSGPDIHKPLPNKLNQTSSSVSVSPMKRPAAAGGGGNRDW